MDTNTTDAEAPVAAEAEHHSEPPFRASPERNALRPPVLERVVAAVIDAIGAVAGGLSL